MRVGADTVAVDVVIVVVIGGDHFVPSNLFSTLSVARVNYGQEYIKSPFIVHETHIKTHYIEYHIWRHGKIIQMHTRLSVSHSNGQSVNGASNKHECMINRYDITVQLTLVNLMNFKTENLIACDFIAIHLSIYYSSGFHPINCNPPINVLTFNFNHWNNLPSRNFMGNRFKILCFLLNQWREHQANNKQTVQCSSFNK